MSARSGSGGTPSTLERDRLYRAALCHLVEPGDLSVAALLPEMGAEGLYTELAEPSGDARLDQARLDVAARLIAIDPEQLLDRAARAGLRFVVPGDAEWPAQVGDLVHAAPVQERAGVPIGLWVRGPLPLDRTDGAVAIVGARDGTGYGAAIAQGMASVAVRCGAPVISGGALGIDSYAHRGALAANGPTVAVLACGADRDYPATHRDLLARIATDGAVISEAPPGAAPMRMRFLARNRIIAALGRGTVVVEASLRSGALNTANWSERLNRAVMGVPGPIDSAVSQGVHELMRRGGASLVTSGAEVMEVLGRAGAHLVEERRGPARPRDALSVRDRQLLDAVPLTSPASATQIAREAAIDARAAGTILGRLHAAGLVERVGGGWVLTPLAARS